MKFNLQILALISALLAAHTVAANPINDFRNPVKARSTLSVGTSADIAASAALEVSSTTKGLLPPRMTQAQRDAISSPAEGLQVFNTDTAKLNVFASGAWGELTGGGGGGGFTLITGDESNFDTADGDWATYKDAAAATPEDMTGGTAGITCARSTSSPLRGDASLLITHPGTSSRQGEGCSLAVAVDAGDENKTFYWRMMVETGGTYVTDEVKIYAYDVDNAALIMPRCSGTNKVWTCAIGLTNSSNYRVGFHVAGTGTAAWTLKADEIKLAEETIVDVPVKQYLGALTTTGAWVANTSYSTFKYWRDDEYLVGEGTIAVAGGAPTSATLTLNLPSSLNLNTSKMGATTNNAVNSRVVLQDAGDDPRYGTLLYSSATALTVAYYTANTTDVESRAVTQLGPFTWGDGDSIFVQYRVPILEWSNSSALMSTSELMNQTVKVVASTASTQAIGTTQTDVIFGTEAKDSHNAFNTTTGVFTAPKSGWYLPSVGLVSASVLLPDNQRIQSQLVTTDETKVIHYEAGNAGTEPRGFGGPAGLVWLDAGDTLKVQGVSAVATTLSGSANDNWLSIVEVPDFTVYGAGGTTEYKESVISAFTNFPTTGQYGDLTSISLTSGEWDVSAILQANLNTGTSVTNPRVGISTTSGNSATGLVEGENLIEFLPPTSASNNGSTVPSYRMVLTSTTTVYLKMLITYSGGQPRAKGRLSARRIR